MTMRMPPACSSESAYRDLVRLDRPRSGGRDCGPLRKRKRLNGPIALASEWLARSRSVSFCRTNSRRATFACIFRMPLARCTFTMTSLTPRSPAICLFKRPAATWESTSFSGDAERAGSVLATQNSDLALRPAGAISSWVTRRTPHLAKSRVLNGLARKSTAPAFMWRGRPSRCLRVATDEHDRNLNLRLQELLLQLEAAFISGIRTSSTMQHDASGMQCSRGTRQPT